MEYSFEDVWGRKCIARETHVSRPTGVDSDCLFIGLKTDSLRAVEDKYGQINIPIEIPDHITIFHHIELSVEQVEQLNKQLSEWLAARNL